MTISHAPPRLFSRLPLPASPGDVHVFANWPGERWQVETVHVADDLRDAKCTLLRMCDGACDGTVLDSGRCDQCARPAVESTQREQPEPTPDNCDACPCNPDGAARCQCI